MSQEIRAVLSCGVDYYKGDKPIKGVDYFTQEDIDEIVQQVEAGGIDLSDYAKKSYVDTAIQGLDIPSTTGLASEQYVDNAISSINIPTKVSDLDNDSGFITNIPTATTSTIGGVKVDGSTILIDQNGVISSTANLSDYATKSYVNTAIGNIDSLKKQVVNALPLSDIDTNTIYMVPSVTSSQDNVYEEFIYVNGSWEIIGDTQVDLTNYATKSYVDSAVSAIPAPTTYTAGQGIRIQNNVISTTGQFSGSYNDLRNKPELIPAISATADLEIGDYKLVALVMKEEIPPEEEEGEAQEITVADYSWVPDTQELPVASSTTLGCVKIDNNTIKINNGVISATSAAYTLPKATHYAIGGVKIDNQTIQIDQYGMISTTNQFSGSYNDLTDKPAAYSLPVATTNTLGGVKVDGETITIADGVISATGSGGGSSHQSILNLLFTGNSYESTYESLLSAEVDSFFEDLNEGKVVKIGLNPNATPRIYLNNSTNLLQRTDPGNSYKGDYTLIKQDNNGEGKATKNSSNNFMVYYAGIYYWDKHSRILYYIRNYSQQNSLIARLPIQKSNTSYYISDIIDDITDIKTRIPSNTNTNGDYKLVSSTTAGNATYSWVEDTGGGATYTAGQGITINNNTISTVLPVMNPNDGNGSYTLKAFIEQEEETAWDDELEEDVPTGDYISTLRYDWAYDETQPFPECQESTTGTYKLVATITEEEDTYYDEELDEEVGTGNYTQSLNYDWVPDTSSSSAYVLPTATTSTLGGVKVDGTSITINDGVISATSTGGGSIFTKKVNGISDCFVLEDNLNANYVTPYNSNGSISFTKGVSPDANTILQFNGTGALSGGIIRQGSKTYLNTGGLFMGDNSGSINLGAGSAFIGRNINGNIQASGEGNLVVGCLTPNGKYTNTYSANLAVIYGGGENATGQGCAIIGNGLKITGNYQLATGKNNVADSGNFAHIIGNGSSNSSRSNAYAADWSGNGFYAGDLYVNCNSYTTTATCGGSKVATESYVDTAIANAGSSSSLPQAPSTTGSYILITTVAENSTTQTWESVQIGGSY